MKLILELQANSISEERVEDLVNDQELVTVDGDFYNTKEDGTIVLTFQPYWEDCDSTEWKQFVFYITRALANYL